MKQIHQEFEVGFIWWSLGIAILGGFMLGAHIAMQIGFNMGLPRALDVWIQLHGHLQLIGWTGLFIMGVSLHFLPRMASVPIERKMLLKLILYLTALGLIIKANLEFWRHYINNENIAKIFLNLARLGNIIEFCGIALYIAVLIRTFIKAPNFKKKGFEIVNPFFISFIIGWIVYSLIQLLEIFLERGVWLGWNKYSINNFFNFTLFPISFAFSILNFPLYIHLKPQSKIVKYLGYAYLVFILLHGFLSLPIPGILLSFDSNITALLIDISTLSLLTSSGIIQRIFLPESALSKSPFWRRDGLKIEQTEQTKKPRKGYSDYGEFGRFELLIYSAYTWLLIGLFFDILARSLMILNLSPHYGEDPVRHSFLAGFITLLILGMAQRMLPGFMHKTKIASTKIVYATFILGNIAAFSRVIPMSLPLYLFGGLEFLTKIMLYLFGISGFVAITSLILLLINLRLTFKA